MARKGWAVSQSNYRARETPRRAADLGLQYLFTPPKNAVLRSRPLSGPNVSRLSDIYVSLFSSNLPIHVIGFALRFEIGNYFPYGHSYMPHF